MTNSCHRCGTLLMQGHDVCPNCGAAVSRLDEIIRCRRCYRRAPSRLEICPHCGRRLEPWRPDRPAAAAGIGLLLLLWLIAGGGGAWLARTGNRLASLAPPRTTPVTPFVPIAGSDALIDATPALAATATPAVIVILPTQSELRTATPIPSTQAEVPTPGDTPVSDQLLTPTPLAQPSPTSTNSDVITYIVQAGDTPIGIASRFGVDVDALLAYNNIADPTSLRVDQELRIPPAAAPTATPPPATAPPTATATSTLTEVPSPTPTTAPPTPTRAASSPTPTRAAATPRPATPTRAAATATATRVPATATQVSATPTSTATTTGRPTTYTVRPGDTPIGIANRFGISVQALLTYNNISNPTTLRVNQVLQIPPVDYTPAPPTPTAPAATPRSATPTPAAVTPTPAIALPAPVLVNPGQNSAYTGSGAFIVLQWQNPGGLPENVENVLHIGVLVGPDTIDWRFVEPVGRATELTVPAWLFDQAPQEFGRTYIWYVQAAQVDRQVTPPSITPLSSPSPQWRFYWN